MPVAAPVCLFLALLGFALPAGAATLLSPDGRIEVRVSIDDKIEPYPQGRRLYYSVRLDGRAILLDSPLGLDFSGMPALVRNLRIAGESRRTVDESWQTVVGKSREVRDRANELTLAVEETVAPGRRLEIVFRAYDDGVAFRYVIPAQKGIAAFELASERTEFHFAGNHAAWAAQYGSFTTSQETEFEAVTLGQITRASIVGLPLLVRVADAAWVAVTEAGLDDWAGMYLGNAGRGPHALVTRLSPRPDAPGVVVRSTAPRRSPWRVLMIARSAPALIESNLLLNLNEPNQIADPSWITAGRSAWDRWWSGDYAPDATFKLGMNTETMQYFGQFAAEMGWEYLLVDWEWYGDPLSATADITKPIPQIDIPGLVTWARERKLKVLLWLRWNSVDAQMDEAFPLFEKWGIAGVKIDFMDRDDQEMVNFYHRVARKAAEHKLVVDFHGAYKPTGEQRTWPNVMTREGVMGNEYNKWSARVTPVHKVTVPFTRMLAGPMDFTSGGFRHRTKATFTAQNTAPYVMGTRANELAQLVVYESPLQVLCDSPYNYRGQPGLEFYKAVPATWDETKGLDGLPGQFVAVARRSGTKWFIGAMNGDAPRSIAVKLGFLAPGRYTLHAFADRADSPDFPDRVAVDRREVQAGDTVTIPMASGGGYAGWLEPSGKSTP